MERSIPAIAGILALITIAPAQAQSLAGSQSAMNRQNHIAREHDFTFLRSTSDVRRFVQLGLLEPVKGGPDYELAAVSFPYARSAVRTFVERLANQYRAACGEKLVVTSLTRPESRQPRNASTLSVHPAGMAVDLRRSNKASCRRWLESTLLSLEGRGVLDATRERYPAHYHIAVFPQPYLAYVDALTGRTKKAVAAPSVAASLDDEVIQVRVNRGDSLWSIAREHGTTVEALKAANGLSTSRIRAGQTLSIPTNATS